MVNERNREIKFKIWNGKEMEEYILDLSVKENETHKEVHLSPGDILLQYTGLKDKNGVEIYESDVVKAWHSEDENHLYEIYFGGGSFNLEDIRNADENFGENGEDYFLYHGDVISEPRWIEVIGNIYENPKLYKGFTNEK